MAPFLKLISTFSEDNLERGTQFEKLCKWFLENDPLYKAKLEEVWLWDDWPDRWGPDCGIDLIARDTEDNIWAIQAKCYKPDYSVTKKDVDSFLSESTNGKIHNRLLIATTDRIGANARNVIKRQDEIVPVNQLMLSGLLAAPVEWPQSIDELSTGGVKEKYTPKPYQRIAIDKVVATLDKRGQLIMACGTGKTLTALWIAEELESNATLVLLPSLLLLSKTLTEWLTHCNEPFAYLPVCSDETAAKGADSISLSTSELGFPSTTDADEIAAFLRKRGRKVIFSTYQSTPKITEAFKAKKIAPFDLVIADEAHRCAGKASSGYALVLDDNNIPAAKRLFMTATPKLFLAHFMKRAADSGVDMVSMDDEAVFGPVLHKLSFGEAIEQDLLSNYQVVVVGIDNPTYEHMISERRLVETDNQIQSDAQSLASHIALAKAVKDYDLRRVITFHSRINAANDFAKNLPEVIDWMPAKSRPSGEVIANHVSGAMPTSQRENRLQALGEAKDNQRYVLSNARCLSEGVDVPALDGVAFIDPRSSEIDIVQAVGRAIRLSKSKSVGTIVIPVFINETDEPDEILNSSPFKKVWAVVNALRSHDDLLGEQLDQLRVQLGKRGTVGKPDNIVFDLPVKITEQFEKAIEIKLLESTTASWEFWFGLLKNFKQEHAHCLVPAKYKTEDDFSLGTWVQHQRMKKDTLTAERILRLDDLGMVWDPFLEQWEQNFAALKTFQQQNGHCFVAANHKTKDGSSLGGWVGNQRAKKDHLSIKQIQRLNDLGFVWDQLAEQWEQGIVALSEFKRENGNCLVPVRHKTDDGFNLGTWVNQQRNKQDKMSKERRRRLNDIEFVWDARKELWEQGIEALIAFKQENGHVRVPIGYKTVEGFNLGAWLRKRRHKRNMLSSEQIQNLNDIGIEWDPLLEQWEQGFAALDNFKQVNGNCLVAAKYKTADGYNLGRWVSKQRSNKDSLSGEKVQRLNDLGFDWDPRGTLWEQGFETLRDYKRENGDCLVIHEYKTKEGFALDNWVANQRATKDKLSAENVVRLDDLGFIWDVLEARWERGFDALRAYKQGNGDCMVSQQYQTEDGYNLGRWISKQRAKKDKLSVEKIARLDDLGFVWNVKK